MNQRSSNSSATSFNNDINNMGSYVYTQPKKHSANVANQRLTKATLDYLNLKGKRVVDFGCGDGVYSQIIFEKSRPKYLLGVDLATKAITRANKLYKKPNKLVFKSANLESPPLWLKKKKFEVGIARGLIHHFTHPKRFFSNSLLNVNELLILEPNGWNPVLKIIEKISPYHRKHNEKSYTFLTLKNWLNSAGYTVVQTEYIGLVPFFSPDWLVKILKTFEPIIENTPIIKQIFCGVVVIRAKKTL